jgi:hypothetical protein
MRTKAGATGRHNSPPYLPYRPWPSPSLSPVSTKGKAVTLVYSGLQECDDCNIIVKSFGKRSPLISRITEQFEETKEARKHVKLQWIPAHRGITGKEKADKLAKHSVRHGRNS